MAMENQKDRRVFNLVNSTPDIGPPVARRVPFTGRFAVSEDLPVLSIIEGQYLVIDQSGKSAHGPATGSAPTW